MQSVLTPLLRSDFTKRMMESTHSLISQGYLCSARHTGTRIYLPANTRRNQQFRQRRKAPFDAPRALAGVPGAFGRRHFPSMELRADPFQTEGAIHWNLGAPKCSLDWISGLQPTHKAPPLRMNRARISTSLKVLYHGTVRLLTEFHPPKKRTAK